MNYIHQNMKITASYLSSVLSIHIQQQLLFWQSLVLNVKTLLYFNRMAGFSLMNVFVLGNRD